MAKLDGAIKFLLQTIADQLNFSNDPKNMLLQNLETYLPDIYQYSELIMNGVIKPIAYSVLGFLLLLEFQQMAQKNLWKLFRFWWHGVVPPALS